MGRFLGRPFRRLNAPDFEMMAERFGPSTSWDDVLPLSEANDIARMCNRMVHRQPNKLKPTMSRLAGLSPVKEHKLVGHDVRVSAYELADVARLMVTAT